MRLPPSAFIRVPRPAAPTRAARSLAVTLLVAATLVAPAAAQQGQGWFAQLGGERSSVTLQGIDTTWGSETLAFGLTRPEAGGWRAYGERQERGDLVDYAFGASAYRRLGDWTVAGGAAGSSDASFWFRRAFDAELSRRIVGTRVASTAYRYMAFTTVNVHQAQPALTWYNPRGEVQLRTFITRNATLERTSWAGLLRTTVRLDDRVTLTAALAGGDRIFDIASLALDAGTESWTARGGVRFALTPHDEIEVGGGFAGENPGFRQRTLALSYRRTF